MDPDFAQRRRVFVAAAITAVAIPAVFLFDRGDSDPTPPIGTLVGTVPTADAAGASPAASGAELRSVPSSNSLEATILGTLPTGYLDGTVPPGDGDPPRIAIPRPRDTVTGDATFSASVTNVAACIVPAAPNGGTITLTNLDNGRSVQCRAVAVAGNQIADAVLHPDAFAVIADITDAPVPVEISW